jgi:hypothetical protein
VITVRDLVDGEVALEHTSRRPKRCDACFDVGTNIPTGDSGAFVCGGSGPCHRDFYLRVLGRKAVMLEKTYEAVDGQLTAMGADLFEVGALRLDAGGKPISCCCVPGTKRR